MVELIRDRIGVLYDRRHLAKLLSRLGFTPQKSRTVAREQDPEAVEDWRKVAWSRMKKTERHGDSNDFLDDTGFLLQPLNRQAWAPAGCTPAIAPDFRTADRGPLASPAL